MVEFSELKGQTLVSIEKAIKEDRNEAIIFKCESGKSYLMTHFQECCEMVDIEDICGELNDLLGSPILVAEEAIEDNGGKFVGEDNSSTWTFYKLSTIKGSVTIRWYGTSNGYYSENVDFMELP